MPLHVRWELYPVPHENPLRAEHGGSYFESQQWWRKPQEKHRSREWMAMFQEIIFMKSLREFNPRLWIPSFLFHSGLYLSILAAIALLMSVLPGLLISGPGTSKLTSELAPVSGWLGLAGAALVISGAILLLMRRINDPALKNYTKAGDILNLLFFIFTFAVLAVAHLMSNSNTARIEDVFRAAFRFDRSLIVGPALGSGLVLASALAAYIPFTHMSHFIGKYFTWHSVRWDDKRNDRGGAMESNITASLNYRPTWAAPHVGADGKKSWAEIAASKPAEEVRK
jgi:nitrate reductase gamma subunit